ncbi:MAG: CBS domain-containing protein [Hydrogenobacter sp.]|uniref:CBS domain-containing protein n=1 Tax=Hydrogenobacter thermophilus TaxID=940 RepID=UPI0030F9516A
MVEAITLQAHQPVGEAKRLMQEYLSEKIAKDIMSVNVITVKPEESIAKTLRELK